MTPYETASAYLKKAAERGSKLGLERIYELLDSLGDPQKKTRIIHISGTNGKGSFGAMLSSILKCSGYTVGGFSSPYITSYTDSFRINCNEISENELASMINGISPVCEVMDDKPTEFEVMTAAAYKLFAEKNCDIALVECGMGGDLDSTNVIDSAVLSVITNVCPDHCAFLGNTVSEIALHKSGIIKKGCPVLFGGGSDEAEKVIRGSAEKHGSRLYITDHSRMYAEKMTLGDTRFSFKGFGSLRMKLLGDYQLTNAANVLEAVDILRSEGYDIPDRAVAQGLENVQWHGRFEVISREPLIIFDGSHNPDGIRSCADSIRRYFGDNKVTLMIGVMADKDYGLYADMLGSLTLRAFTVTPDNPRALDSVSLAEGLSAKGMDAVSCSDIKQGFAMAREFAALHNAPLIVLGSLFLYKDIKVILS